MEYKKIDEKIIREFEDVLGTKNVLKTKDEIIPYSKDETSDASAIPELVVKPCNTKEVSQIMAIANKHLISITPRGLGTGVSGGALPIMGGAVLSLERFTEILEIDKKNMVAVVEPGVITGELQEAVKEQGLFYPPDPASLESCSIGGNIAEGAGGPSAVKYGTTRIISGDSK